jgi:hypothetical protein
MPGTSTISGGVKHGLAVLSHSERSAAQHILANLNKGGSATVFGGVKSARVGGATFIHGGGNDTFLGGAGSASTHALSKIGNDTVVSGSRTGGRSLSDARSGQGAHGFNLNSDTINVKGVTAEGVKSEQPREAATGSHTIALSEKTTVTVSGLTKHDVGKLSH